MDEALGAITTLVKTLRLQEIKGKPEVFSFYFGLKIPREFERGKLVNNSPLMFVIDIVDGGKNILAFDLFMLGKPQAKKLYETFKPFANIKRMDQETFKDMRDSLLKEFPSIAKMQLLKKYPSRYFHSIYDVPVDKVVPVIEKFDALYSLVR